MKGCLQLAVTLPSRRLARSRCLGNVHCSHHWAEGGKVSPNLVGPQGPALACGTGLSR